MYIYQNSEAKYGDEAFNRRMSGVHNFKETVIHYVLLALKAPITTVADDIHKYFFFLFFRKYMT